MTPLSTGPLPATPAPKDGSRPDPLLEAARRLAPELSSRAREGERLRTMPPDIVEKIRDAGLFRMAVPAVLGGHERDPLTILQVLEELARADGSSGWTTMIGNTTAFVAWLEPSVAKALVAEKPNFTASSVFAPGGNARVDERDGTLIIDGRWTIASGCRHADWHMNGVQIVEGTGHRFIDGKPDWRFAIFPGKDAEIIETWDVLGLRGTGSHDVAVKGVRVPPERTIRPFFEPARFEGPLYRLPFSTLLATWLSAFPLGVARRALDEFATLVQTKSRKFTHSPMIEDGAIRVEFARMEGAVRSARAFVYDAVGEAWRTVLAGDELTARQRSTVALAGLHAARSARAAVEGMFTLAGAGSLYESSPIQRCVRDLSAGTQHLFFSLSQWEDLGGVFLGCDPTSFMI